MSKKSILLAGLLFLCHTFAFANSGLFSGGDGTFSSPFKITTQQDLINLSHYSRGALTIPNGFDQDYINSAYYKQTSDIDLEYRYDYYPIGYSATKGFTGEYDGQFFKIKNLAIRDVLARDNRLRAIGLFGYTSNATIKNINLINPQIEIERGDNYPFVAIVVGYGEGSTVDSVTVSDPDGSDYLKATNSDYVGGIMGFHTGSYGGVYNSHNHVDVNGLNHVGGVLGSSNGTLTINGSGATSEVIGQDYVGGVLGSKSTTSLANVLRDNYFKGIVRGKNFVGGIFGANTADHTALHAITNNYSMGEIHGHSYVGGIAGRIRANAAANLVYVDDNYSHSSIYAEDNGAYIGGIVGHAYLVSERYNDRRLYIQRNYFAGNIQVGLNSKDIGGILGHSVTSQSRNIIVLQKNISLGKTHAPLSATRVGYIVGYKGGYATIANNYYSYASIVSGGATVNTTLYGTQISRLELSSANWWASVLNQDGSEAFDTNTIIDGHLPFVHRHGDFVHVAAQEPTIFDGNFEPEVDDIIYVKGDNKDATMAIVQHGSIPVEVIGLTEYVDYINNHDELIFKASYLEALEPGEYTVVIGFNSGYTVRSKIYVDENLPAAPQLKSYDMSVNIMDIVNRVATAEVEFDDINPDDYKVIQIVNITNGNKLVEGTDFENIYFNNWGIEKQSVDISNYVLNATNLELGKQYYFELTFARASKETVSFTFTME